jgi:hypothetical protein
LAAHCNPLRQMPQGLPVRHSSRCNRHLLFMTRERVLTLTALFLSERPHQLM